MDRPIHLWRKDFGYVDTTYTELLSGFLYAGHKVHTNVLVYAGGDKYYVEVYRGEGQMLYTVYVNDQHETLKYEDMNSRETATLIYNLGRE